MNDSKEFREIDDIFRTGASFIYYFGRTPLEESDEFFSKIEKIKETEELDLSKSELRILYPIGSDWEGFENWISYFGIPFYTQGSWWYAMGKNCFKIHPRRGAYPIGKAYVYNFKNLTSLNLLQFHLSQLLDEEYKEIEQLRLPNEKIIETNIRTPERFKIIEKSVFITAQREFEKGNLFHFRTLLISESLLPESLFVSIDSNKETKKLYLREKKYLLIRNEISTEDSFNEDSSAGTNNTNSDKENHNEFGNQFEGKNVFKINSCSIRSLVNAIIELIKECIKKNRKENGSEH